MATQTRTRRPSSNRQAQARFTRGTPAPARRTPLRPKRRPQQSGLKKLVGGVLPTGGGKKSTTSSSKGKLGGLGGLGAVLAAGAGLAFKNRGKLNELRNRKGDPAPVQVEPTASPVNADSTGPVDSTRPVD